MLLFKFSVFFEFVMHAWIGSSYDAVLALLSLIQRDAYWQLVLIVRLSEPRNTNAGRFDWPHTLSVSARPLAPGKLLTT